MLLRPSAGAVQAVEVAAAQWLRKRHGALLFIEVSQTGAALAQAYAVQ